MSTKNKTAEFLIKYCKTYPKLQIQDLLKTLHQSVFGCGHFVSDKALTFLNDELSRVTESDSPYIESLDGDYSRVYLSFLHRHGLSAETLFELFVMSSEKHCGDTIIFEEKLNTLSELAKYNQILFSYQETETAIEEWKNNNYPACRHSDTYRKAYAPSYRVIHNDFIKWLPLFSAIDKKLHSTKQILVAIEGGSASGKTTLSELLSKIYDCNVFHMDDFFLQPKQRTEERLNTVGGNIDCERFSEQVLIPLSNGKTINYIRFDCSTQTLINPVEISKKQLNIIEGVYCMHPMLSEHYDLSVFLDINKDLQKARIHKRNSEFMQKRFFNEWIPMEEKYFTATDILNRCDMILEVN